MIDINRIRAEFPALAETDAGRPRLYFDNPAGTQVPIRVAAAMSDCLLKTNANLGGYFRTSELATKVVDDARQAMADFFKAPSPDEVIFGPNMTAITFHLARSLGRHFEAGDEIILSRMDHDANIQPWLLMARDFDLEVRWLAVNTETYEFDLEALDELLTDRTRLVCVGGASNLIGTINDVDVICAKARAAGAWTYIDAVQSAPHVPTDVSRIGCDFFVCSAYKFFGPHMGILWARRDVLNQLEPYRVRPAPVELPWCFEPGTQNHEGMAGTAAAVDYFAWVGESLAPADAAAEGPTERARHIDAAFRYLFAHELELTRQLIAGLESLPGVTIHGVTASDALSRRVSTVSFTATSRTPDEIAQALADRNIFCWSGHNYALELARELGIEKTGGAVRIGAVHYNTPAEVETVLNAIEDVL